MKYYFDTFSTPVGDFSVVLDETGAVAATTFGGKAELQKYFQGELVRDEQATAEARRQVTEFFAGHRRRFTLKLAPRGTVFQKRVWAALEEIPFGETRSYGQVAAAVGNRGAARAVGRANAANPICLLVPCHRVIGADGSLTGFALGEELKRRLLAHEGAQIQP
jgi:methylated-DNA-[protein]-cysteine S-methyltransferase